jgi:hypothetical protein
MTNLYFVTAETKSLTIPASVTSVAESVFSQRFESVTAEDGNPVYYSRDGLLYRRTGEGTEILFIPDGIEVLALPEGVRAAPFCLNSCPTLREITISPADGSQVSALEERRDEIRFTVRTGDSGEIPLHLNSSLTLKKALSILRSREVDVSPGTEGLYLELFFRGRIASPEQRRAFSVSVWQILSALIERDDADMLSRVLRDGRLVTGRNIARLRHLAGERNAERCAALLAEAADLPEKMAV